MSNMPVGRTIRIRKREKENRTNYTEQIHTKLYQVLIHPSKMSYIILLTVENLVFVDHLLKMQNLITSFENVKVLTTSLTTAFYKVA